MQRLQLLWGYAWHYGTSNLLVHGGEGGLGGQHLARGRAEPPLIMPGSRVRVPPLLLTRKPLGRCQLKWLLTYGTTLAPTRQDDLRILWSSPGSRTSIGPCQVQRICISSPKVIASSVSTHTIAAGSSVRTVSASLESEAEQTWSPDGAMQVCAFRHPGLLWRWLTSDLVHWRQIDQWTHHCWTSADNPAFAWPGVVTLG